MEIFLQDSNIVVISVGVNLQLIFVRWLAYIIFKLIEHEAQRILIPFASTKRSKEERDSFYARRDNGFIPFREFIVISLRFFLFFLTNVQISSTS